MAVLGHEIPTEYADLGPECNCDQDIAFGSGHAPSARPKKRARRACSNLLLLALSFSHTPPIRALTPPLSKLRRIRRVIIDDHGLLSCWLVL